MSPATLAAIRLGTAALLLPAMIALHAFLQTAVQAPTVERQLFHAVCVRSPLLLRYALEDGADVNSRDESGSTALHFGALIGDRIMVTRLLESGAHVDAVNDQGMTPLMLAASNNRAAMVAFLLDRGADSNLQAFHTNATAKQIAHSNEAWDAFHAITFHISSDQSQVEPRDADDAF